MIDGNEKYMEIVVHQPRHSVWSRIISARRTLLLTLLTLSLSGLATGCDELGDLKKGAEKAGQAVEHPAILTGSKKGNYYKTAVELNSVLPADEGLAVKASAGSFANLADLGNNKAQYAIAQYDTLMMFLKMKSPYPKLANNSLAVAPLSNEQVHIIVNKKASIKTIADLKGKRIAAGTKRSGSFVSAFTIMVYFNDINLEKYDKAVSEPYETSLKKLRAGQLDALFITTAKGMPLLGGIDASASKEIEILDVGTSTTLPRAVEHTYVVESLPKSTYPWQERDVHQLATPSYLFAQAKYTSAQVRKVAKAIYGNQKKLNEKSGLWGLATRKQAEQHMKHGVGFHAGARAYFASGK